LFTTTNGLQIIGDCGPDYVGVRLLPVNYLTDTLRASGTKNTIDANTDPVDINAASPNNQATAGGETGSVRADLDVIASAGAGSLSRIDAHGDRSGSTCNYWGMVTPTS
jgi:hypothetical protein